MWKRLLLLSQDAGGDLADAADLLAFDPADLGVRENREFIEAAHRADPDFEQVREAAAAVAFFEEHGILHRRHEHRGGHSLPVSLVRTITEWMKDPSADTSEAGPKER